MATKIIFKKILKKVYNKIISLSEMNKLPSMVSHRSTAKANNIGIKTRTNIYNR